MAFAHYAAESGKGCFRAAAEDLLHALGMGGACLDDLDTWWAFGGIKGGGLEGLGI